MPGACSVGADNTSEPGLVCPSRCPNLPVPLFFLPARRWQIYPWKTSSIFDGGKRPPLFHRGLRWKEYSLFLLCVSKGEREKKGEHSKRRGTCRNINGCTVNPFLCRPAEAKSRGVLGESLLQPAARKSPEQRRFVQVFSLKHKMKDARSAMNTWHVRSLPRWSDESVSDDGEVIWN